MSWYGIRCIFKWRDQYEERITLWRASTFEDAIRLAETEAIEYQANTDLEYLGLAQGYDLRADAITNGTEVFSLVRRSSLEPDEYISRYFDTGSESQTRALGPA
jgi:hypothetical protein